jgi:hypothetical protein
MMSYIAGWTKASRIEVQLHGFGLMSEPWMKPLRDDPRFPALKAKVGLWNKVRSF